MKQLMTYYLTDFRKLDWFKQKEMQKVQEKKYMELEKLFHF